MKKILIIGAGAPADVIVLRKLQQWADTIICADGGADAAKKAGILPHVVIGDFDSISSENLDYYNQNKDVTLVNIREQETTDMEKAIIFTLSIGSIADIIIIGAGGSRTDHFLHTIGLMFKYRDKARIRIIEGENFISLKTKSFRDKCRIGETISLIPYGGQVNNVGTVGLKFPVQGENFIPGLKESISNQASQDNISVNFDGGNLLYYRNAVIGLDFELEQ
ncbi:MAG: thiamine diphosphokinase [FCB group bacterium]|nr:thiamine diphosphokinase [FCB group bacterium]